jgi:Fe2+ or Zn2+ uptake regulation protein
VAGGLRNLAPRGFQVTDHEIILYGLCKSCA